MSTHFIHDDFLLESEPARHLYHSYAEPLPIIDYHCHLSAQHIAENASFRNMTEAWLEGDHYKWRAMRTAGVSERYMTGAADDWEKFLKWAETVPKTLRNSLYHWTHLELRRPFDIQDRLLNAATARSIWDACNAKLVTPEFTTQGILRRMNVEVVCTTDDPTDDLRYHEAMRSAPSLQLHPAFRCDNAVNVEDPVAFGHYVKKLGNIANLDIRCLDDFLTALDRRHTHFHERGCRLSDVGVERFPVGASHSTDASALFSSLISGNRLSADTASALKAELLYELSVMHHRRGWVQQFHIGALRDTNTRMLREVGRNTGFDSIADAELARPIAAFLDRLDSESRLTKTILFNLNPRDNELLAAMIGNFQDGSVAAKVQYGAAWWFLDQRDGITRHLDALSNMSLLSQFVGMLTDSRSFLSYPRHEYFRRILCNLLGDEVTRGLIPNDLGLVGEMVEAICYKNAQSYFALGRAEAEVSQ